MNLYVWRSSYVMFALAETENEAREKILESSGQSRADYDLFHSLPKDESTEDEMFIDETGQLFHDLAKPADVYTGSIGFVF